MYIHPILHTLYLYLPLLYPLSPPMITQSGSSGNLVKFSNSGSIETNLIFAATFFSSSQQYKYFFNSILTPNQTLGYPLPQSGGRHFKILSGLLVRIWY